MELVEFQVGNPATGAPGHGDAIAAGAIRVAGIEVGLAGPTGGHRHEACLEQFNVSAVTIQDISAVAAPILGDQVYRHAVCENIDIVTGQGIFDQHLRDRLAGGIGGVNHAAVAVATFHGQVKFTAVVLVAAVKYNAEFHQPFDHAGTAADDELDHILFAEAGTGRHGIGDMGLDGVILIEYRCHAALGPEGRALGQFSLAQYRHTTVGGQLQRQGQAGGPTAQDQDIVFVTHVSLVTRSLK